VPLERNVATGHVLYQNGRKKSVDLASSVTGEASFFAGGTKKKRVFHGHVPESVASSQQLIFLWASLGHLRKEAMGASFCRLLSPSTE
jgi:hypothetical protein